MKKTVILLLCGCLWFGCGPKELTREEALVTFKTYFPLDTTYQTITLELKTWNSLNNYVERGVLEQLPPEEHTDGGYDANGFLHIAIYDDRNKYVLTDKGKSFALRYDNLEAVVRYFALSDYEIFRVYSPENNTNEAEVQVQVGYNVTPFFKDPQYGVGDWKTVTCRYKRFDNGWEIENAEEVRKQLISHKDFQNRKLVNSQ